MQSVLSPCLVDGVLQVPYVVGLKAVFSQELEAQSGKNGLCENVSWASKLPGHECGVGGEQACFEGDEVEDGGEQEFRREQAREDIGRAFGNARGDASQVASLGVEDYLEPADGADGVVHGAGVMLVAGGVDGVLADDFADEVGEVVSALKMLPNVRQVPVLGGH